MEVKKFVNALYQVVWKLHNLSKVLVSDHGSQFNPDFWQFLFQRLKIYGYLSMSIIQNKMDKPNKITHP